MGTTMQDVCGAPEPSKVEWEYLKKKKKKSNIIRRTMNKVEKISEAKRLEMNSLSLKDMWNKITSDKRVPSNDYEVFIDLEDFYSSFKQKHNKQPTVSDVEAGFLSKRGYR